MDSVYQVLGSCLVTWMVEGEGLAQGQGTDLLRDCCLQKARNAGG